MSLGTHYVCSAWDAARGDVWVVGGVLEPRRERCGVESSAHMLGFFTWGPQMLQEAPELLGII